MIHPELVNLLEIQDIKSELRELVDEGDFQDLEKDLFQVDVPHAVRELSAGVEEMEALLEPPIRRRYDRVTGRMDRAVVPVIRGLCYGCFTAIAVSVAAQDHGSRLETCENCGRFIYVAD